MAFYRDVVGIDIAPRSVKAVRASLAFGSVRVLGTASRARSGNFGELAGIVSELLRTQGWSRLPCVLGLSGNSTLFRIVPLVESGEQNLEQVLAQHRIEPDAGETVLDADRMWIDDRELVLISEARRDTVDQWLAFQRSVGMNLVELATINMALYAATAHRMGDEPVLVADIGETGTDLVVGTGEGILFTRSFTTSSETLAQPFRSRLEPGGAWIAEWVERFKGFLESYRGHDAKVKLPVKVILGGDGAGATGLAEKVEEATGIMPEPWKADIGKTDEEASTFAAALGLARIGLKQTPVHISMLPQEERETRSLQWQLRYWVTSAAALVIAGLLVCLFTFHYRNAMGARLTQQRQAMADRLRVEEELGALRLSNLKLRGKIDALDAAVHNGRVLRAVIQAVAAAKHPDDWVTLIADEHSYFVPAPAPSENSAAPVRPMQKLDQTTVKFDRVIVEGFTPVADLSVIREMIATLKENPMVVTADLLADDEVRKDAARDAAWADTQCRLFAVEITLAAEGAGS